MEARRLHGDAIVGAVLCALGLWWLWMSWALGVGSFQEPGPGFFPAAISIALAAGGLGCALRALRIRSATEPKTWVEPAAAKAAALIILLCVFFAIGGFLLCSLVFLFLTMRFVGNVGTGKAVLVAVIATAVFWLVFERLFSLQLPTGFLIGS